MADRRDPATVKAMAALDAMAATWAARINLRADVRTLLAKSDAESRLVAYIQHAYGEGLYEGRTSWQDSPPLILRRTAEVLAAYMQAMRVDATSDRESVIAAIRRADEAAKPVYAELYELLHPGSPL